jgi:hypothetical protein
MLRKKNNITIEKVVDNYFKGKYTLKSVMTRCGIKSNTRRRQYSTICKSLTNKQLHDLFDYVMAEVVERELRSLLSKDRSALSRERVTVILDDSVFKEWRGRLPEGLSDEERAFYGKFYSVQFSCDSAYSILPIHTACERNRMSMIGVPKKSAIITINDEKMTVQTWIETVFLPAEAAHNTTSAEPFMCRARVHYQAFKADVTILAFRLNKSNKVTVIFSPDKLIFKKTLRRHWFARTQIEQFFRLLKHFMCIQQPITPQHHLMQRPVK